MKQKALNFIRYFAKNVESDSTDEANTRVKLPEGFEKPRAISPRQFIYKPAVLVLLWLAFLLSPLISVFRLYFLVKKDIFNIHIAGLSAFFLYLPFLISLMVLIILILWFKRFIDKKIPKTYQKALIFISITSLVFLVIARILLVWEEKNYPNFLYSHFGLTVSQVETMSFVVTLELFVFLFLLSYNRSFKLLQNRLEKVALPSSRWQRHQLPSSRRQRYSLFLALVGLSSLMVFSISPFIGRTKLLGEVKGGYESKVGVHYKYIVLLAENSPSSAEVMVIHPPQGEKWPAIGNQPILRYFLFPRTLISGALVNNQEFAKQIGIAYFVEIDPFLDTTHWPKIDQVNKVVTFNEQTEIEYWKLETVFKEDEKRIYRIHF